MNGGSTNTLGTEESQQESVQPQTILPQPRGILDAKVAEIVKNLDLLTTKNAKHSEEIGEAKKNIQETKSLAILGFIALLITVTLGVATAFLQYYFSLTGLYEKVGQLEERMRDDVLRPLPSFSQSNEEQSPSSFPQASSRSGSGSTSSLGR